MSSLSILTRGSEESWNAFLRRIRSTEGEVIVVLSSADNVFLLPEDERHHFIDELAKLRYRARLASKEPVVVRSARAAGIQVYDRTRKLRRALTGHEKLEEALRFFSPSLWRQQWRSRLQAVGLLSLPKVRVWILVSVSALLFLFVVFRLLPSARVKVWPRSELVVHTMNIALVDPALGTGAKIPSHVRTLPLVPVRVTVKKTITFTDISKEFIGTDAETVMTVQNASTEEISLRGGSRLTNQAGMVFRTRDAITVPAKGKVGVRAKADHLDLYGEVLGERGNVPAGVAWTFPALDASLQKLVTAANMSAATGGRTAYRSVLRKEDLEVADKRLRQELLATAKQMVEEERADRNADGTHQLEFLSKEDVIQKTYSGVTLPTQFIGQAVDSVPVEGTLIYTVPAYELTSILDGFSQELYSHVGEGKQLVPGSVHVDPEKVIIIEYADDFTWIKITVDLVGTEQFVLDPLDPAGLKFGRKLRETVVGISKADALRIIRNFPEVDHASISTWPPWNGLLPAIPSSIAIEPQ